MQDYSNEYAANNITPNQDVDIKFLVAKVIGNWYWYLLSIILFLGLGVLIMLYTSPRYAVTARVLVNGYTSQGKGLTGLSEGNLLSDLGLFSVPNTVSNELEIIHSRTLVEQTVRDLQLNVTYMAKGPIRYEESYKNSPFQIKLISLVDMLPSPIEYDIRIDGGKVKFKDEDTDSSFTASFGDTLNFKYGKWVLLHNPGVMETNPKHQLGMIITTYGAGLNKYLGDLEAVTTNEFVNIIDLEIDGPTPQKNEDALRHLIKIYISSSIDDRNIVADSTIQFINSRLTGVAADLDMIDRGIENFKKVNHLTDLSEDAKAVLSNTGSITEQLAQAGVALKIVDDLEKYLTDERNNSRVMPTTAPIKDPAFVQTLDKYNSMQLQRQTYLQNSTEANPAVKSLDIQLTQLRGDLISMMRTYKSGVALQKADLEQRNNVIQGKMSSVPTQEREYLDFTRKQNVMQQLYLYLLQTKEQTAVAKANNIAPVRIIDEPQRAPLPYFPNIIIIAAAAIFLGLVVPSVAIFMKELLNNKVITTEDITSSTNVPIVAEISHSKNSAPIIVSKDSRSEVSEQFRTLRTNLQFLLPNPNEKIIMTTSSMGGEGKSYIAMNLACALALSGKKVLLMEMDLRKPRISSTLGLENNIGFSNYIVSDMKLSDIIKPSTIHPNCFLIGSGSLPPNPAELLVHDKVNNLFADLRAQFDYIVVDCSPVGLVTDALLLGKYADIVLYITRQRYTFKKQINLIQTLSNDRKFRKIDIIFNDVKSIPGYGYGYGYGYSSGYKYGYSGYYEDENKSFFRKLFNFGGKKKKA